MAKPPTWTEAQLAKERAEAIELFRRHRGQEPVEDYSDMLDDVLGKAEEFLETTVDLSQVNEVAVEILTDKEMLEILRNIAGPPISQDDLRTMVGTSIAKTHLQKNPTLARDVIQIVLDSLDRRRFPWLSEGRQPTEAERHAATLSTAVLVAVRRTGTRRRNVGKAQQEQLVRSTLSAHGYEEVAARIIRTLADAPDAGQFCGESLFGPRKADVVVRLWDQRAMPIECKVSNSEVNSIKRLNNDAAVKAVAWRRHFGEGGVVPVAVLSGVYDLKNLVAAQSQGLTLFWAHDLQAMLDWIDTTPVQSG